MLIIKTPTYKEMAYISKDKLRNKPPENIMVTGIGGLGRNTFAFKTKWVSIQIKDFHFSTNLTKLIILKNQG